MEYLLTYIPNVWIALYLCVLLSLVGALVYLFVFKLKV